MQPGGDTINVATGTYYEHVKVNKEVTIQAEEGSSPIVDGSNSGSCFDIYYNPGLSNVTIDGFGIQNAVRGVWIYGAPSAYSNITISNNDIHNHSNNGILVTDASITGLLISDNSVDNSGIGISFANNATVTDLTVERNRINNNNAGLGLLWGSFSNVTVSNCYFEGNAWEHIDLGVTWTGPATISNVQISNCEFHTVANWGDVYIAATFDEKVNDDYNVRINYNEFLGPQNWGVINTTTTVVDAIANWWGDVSGPKDTLNADGLDQYNPDGLGDNVGGHIDWLGQDCEYVLYDPWIGQAGMVTGGGWIDSPAGAMPPTTLDVTVSGISGDTSTDPDAGYAPYYLRYVGNPPPAGYDPSHNYQWGSPAIFTPSPEDGPVTLSGTIDVDEQTVGQVAMIGLLDIDDLAAGNSSFQRGAYIYIYRSSLTSWKIGPSDGNVGGEIVQTFITIADTDLPADGILDVTFTVDGTSDGTTCAAGPSTTPAGCMTLQITGGLVNATLTDSYGDVVGNNSASPEFANGAVLGWDDYLGSYVGFTLTVPSMTSGSPEGKATFGFVAKKKEKAQTPDGNTEFMFKAADLNFHSNAYDWLVVNKNESRAQFKGSGTINGEGDYKFMLWATDGDPSDNEDTFRIKIWWEDTDDIEHVVYDNGFEGSGYEKGQPIGGGNIVVHTGKK